MAGGGPECFRQWRIMITIAVRQVRPSRPRDATAISSNGLLWDRVWQLVCFPTVSWAGAVLATHTPSICWRMANTVQRYVPPAARRDRSEPEMSTMDLGEVEQRC